MIKDYNMFCEEWRGIAMNAHLVKWGQVGFCMQTCYFSTPGSRRREGGGCAQPRAPLPPRPGGAGGGRGRRRLPFAAGTGGWGPLGCVGPLGATPSPERVAVPWYRARRFQVSEEGTPRPEPSLGGEIKMRYGSTRGKGWATVEAGCMIPVLICPRHSEMGDTFTKCEGQQLHTKEDNAGVHECFSILGCFYDSWDTDEMSKEKCISKENDRNFGKYKMIGQSITFTLGTAKHSCLFFFFLLGADFHICLWNCLCRWGRI